MKKDFSSLWKVMVETQTTQWAIFFLVIILVTALSFPLRFWARSLAQKTTELNTKVIDAEGVAAQSSSFDLIYSDQTKALENLRAKTLKMGEQAKVVALITDKTKDLKLSILSMRPVADEKEKEKESAPPPPGISATDLMNMGGAKKLKSLYFALGLGGSYRSVGTFLERIRSTSPLVRVQELVLTPEEKKPGILRAELKLLAYEERV